MKFYAPRLRAVTWVVSGLLFGGCAGQSITSLTDHALSPESLESIVVSPQVTIVAVGGTQQLAPVGHTYAGAAVTTFDSVLYRYNNPGDAALLQLSNTGLITGVSAGATTVVINVYAFKDGALRASRALAQVTETVIPGLQLSIQPVPPDSAKLSPGIPKTIDPILRNPTTEAEVINPPMWYFVRGADAARVDVYNGWGVEYNGYGAQSVPVGSATSNFLSPKQIVALSGEGTVWIHGAVTAYGTVLEDSVLYTLTYPYTATMTTVKTNLAVTNSYAGQVLTLAPGATVTFQNGVASSDPLTVAYTFDNPAAATAADVPSTSGGASGNVTTLTGGQSSARKFVTPGTYHWTATTAGGPAPWTGVTLSGTIVIK